MESGLNIKDVVKQIAEIKKENYQLHQELDKTKYENKLAMSKIQTKLKATKFFLTKTNNEVVKPLM